MRSALAPRRVDGVALALPLLERCWRQPCSKAKARRLGTNFGAVPALGSGSPCRDPCAARPIETGAWAFLSSKFRYGFPKNSIYFTTPSKAGRLYRRATDRRTPPTVFAKRKALSLGPSLRACPNRREPKKSCHSRIERVPLPPRRRR